jgi:hypothetical protein
MVVEPASVIVTPEGEQPAENSNNEHIVYKNTIADLTDILND